jgi:hypothetical protein
MLEEIENRVLLMRDKDGHMGFSMGGETAAAMERFSVTRNMPAKGTVLSDSSMDSSRVPAPSHAAALGSTPDMCRHSADYDINPCTCHINIWTRVSVCTSLGLDTRSSRPHIVCTINVKVGLLHAYERLSFILEAVRFICVTNIVHRSLRDV